ncbi:MAG TPA: alpha-glucan family phosphorylase [Phycisphaerales bacterium]|nr:alpha-glucan family phosphorylase [Phycisphaerales bacterium]
MPDPTIALAASRLPDALAPLARIAYDLWFSFSRTAQDIFREIDPERWEHSGHNPVAVLAGLGPDRIARLAADRGFAARVAELAVEHAALLGARARCHPESGEPEAAPRGFQAAYFCAEFGLARCLPVYCGGLGLLAGDHLKSAAELGVPLVGVGLLYAHGYFRQRLDEHGTQHEDSPRLDLDRLPLRRALDHASGSQLVIHLDMPGRRVAAAIWRADVGPVRLYLLDTDVPDNAAGDRGITSNLYLGDHVRRIEQELVLGVGGVRALRAAGEEPTVFHMNEGHAAFLALERVRELRAANPGLSFDQVREAVAAGNVFTTHTPLPAGIDRFDPALVSSYLGAGEDGGLTAGIGLDTEGLLALGRENVFDRNEHFSMAVLALRTSRQANGVSRLHGHVSRGMWGRLWPHVREADIPIGHVTNGVHVRSWLGPEMAELYERHLGPGFLARPDEPSAWGPIADIPDAALWRARSRARARLVEFARARLAASPLARDTVPSDVLDDEALTIGFARRFAPYKRATLLFRDPARLARLLLHPRRPVQLLLAGKAHPGDETGKGFIRQIVEITRAHGLGRRVVFLEDYDIGIAAELVAGVDVWLNNPVRGLEASGTSGMKAALNGVINCSIPDGWWDEAHEPELGFAFGHASGADEPGDSDRSPEQRDDDQSRALFEVLETEVVPEFYARSQAPGSDEPLPRQWLERMKRSIAALAPRFTTHRMVAQYARELYYPAHHGAARLGADGLRAARELSDHIDRYRALWPGVRIERAGLQPGGGSPPRLRAVAEVALGTLDPCEVQVQLVPARGTGDERAVPLRLEAALGLGRHRYGALVPGPQAVGEAGAHVRVLPHDTSLMTPFVPGLITIRQLDEPHSAHSVVHA